MKKHPVIIEGYDGTFEELGRKVGELRYDKLAEFLLHLENELARQAIADKKRGRPKLANLIEGVELTVKDGKIKTERLFEFCKAFMQEELNNDK
ncbi:MAG: hypothetical protein ACD_81C00135G0006 [uncultured bacterium]|uniref:Uncharacterized protein n=1 Tax=Candidatus Wolfebacteria bacterium GW2011_GWE2_44_13 TaxID=1619017 RepID=A0A0G1H9L2_9BACT|nr:MAG: hypothetical protein ACD_81C00135G0006 [uncultured bacterium]KKT43208.1 MAG: hypothetical protein UW32_C0002G0069 [Candidatus Wolfebacteria bacterium GW2011_GWE2_44_13]